MLQAMVGEPITVNHSGGDLQNVMLSARVESGCR